MLLGKLKASLIKFFIYKIPIIKSFTFFNFQDHKKAIPKFLFLYITSSLPLIGAILLSNVPTPSNSIISILMAKIQESVSEAELFVYAASFISPLLYIIYERYGHLEDDETIFKKINVASSRIFRGYVFVSLVALIMLVLIAISYGSVKIDSSAFEQTVMYYLLKEWIFYIYIYALVCMYLAILDSVWSPSDFVLDNRASEESLAEEFSRRVNKERG